MKTADEIIDDILDNEGPGDPSRNYLAKNDLGGRTNWGISERAHPEEWADGKVPSKDRAREIYRDVYVKPFATIKHDRVRAQLVDWCVLHGEGRTRKWVTRTMMGSLLTTTQATNEQINGVAQLPYLDSALVAFRLKLIDEISDANVRQKANEEGWENRALSFLGTP